MEEEAQNPEKTVPVPPKAGSLVKAARLAADIEPAKLCADLRISTEALAALEAGQYDRLPGDPYVRALLGSISRQLRLDPQDVLKAYNAEVGGASTTAPVAPYKDLSQTHIMAHKQIFILILAVLLFTLLLILGKLNASNGSAASDAAPVDSLSPAAALDSLPESQSLRPDSAGDSVEARLPDSGLGPSGSVGNAASASSTVNRVVVKPVLDSVWIRVQRKGKPETVQLLLLGKQMEVTHSDTIALILGKRKSVEVVLGDTTLIPAQKRFRIVDSRITYY
jgi:cytoskeleton protein RodZ